MTDTIEAVAKALKYWMVDKSDIRGFWAVHGPDGSSYFVNDVLAIDFCNLKNAAAALAAAEPTIQSRIDAATRERNEEIARLREAVKSAAFIFEDYERLHWAKDTVDGYEKAARNRRLGKQMRAALTNHRTSNGDEG